MDTKEQKSQLQRNFQEKCRVEAVTHYGGKCKDCGNDDMAVLTPFPEKFNALKKIGLSQIGYKLRKAGFPKGFGVLCQNCLHKVVQVWGERSS